MNNAVLQNYLDVGSAAYARGQFRMAGKMFYAAFREAKKCDEKDPRLTTVFANLGVFYFQQRRYRKAEQLCKKAIVVHHHNGLISSHAATTMHLLGDVYRMQGKMLSALRSYKQAIKILHTLAADHSQQNVLFEKIIDEYCSQQKFSLAESWCRKGLRAAEVLATEPARRKFLLRLAWLRNEQKDFAGAARFFEQAHDKRLDTQTTPAAITRSR